MPWPFASFAIFAILRFQTVIFENSHPFEKSTSTCSALQLQVVKLTYEYDLLALICKKASENRSLLTATFKRRIRKSLALISLCSYIKFRHMLTGFHNIYIIFPYAKTSCNFPGAETSKIQNDIRFSLITFTFSRSVV